MIISLNWLKKFTDINMPIDELAELIGSRLVEIEDIEYLGDKYKDVLVVKVVEAIKMEDSDHLSVCKIDDGGKITDIDRDENGNIQVVCGAPNIKAGLVVVWLPPKSIVPSTFCSSEQFVLDTRTLRGNVSNGMIASAKELDLYDDHTGILEISEDIKPGTSFAEAFELNDYLLNIENKSLTHRPDCFGIIGFAREIAAITGNDNFSSPDWIMNLTPFIGDEKNEISVKIDDPRLSDRYQAIVLGGGDLNKKSPLLIQTYLARVGVRPISAVVDLTNYLMMLTGQPLHAFDFDKMLVAAGGANEYDIHVRSGRDNEKLELLDGRVIELTPEDIVIAAGETAVALAGAMGGKSTVVDENTRSIILESASFNLYKLRSTQMRHGIFSEAITRFTKGQPAELTSPVLGEAVKLAREWMNAIPKTSVADEYPGKKEASPIDVSLNKVNEILGTNLSIQQVTALLSRAEFNIRSNEPSIFTVNPPYWRSDIHIIEDIVEEIGRINGFDNINPTLPNRDFCAISQSDFDNLRSKIRKILVRGGANEVLLYSFVHGDILKKAGLNVDNSYRIVNSISPSLQYYRQTLVPTLLGAAYSNIKQGFDKFAIFEINKVHCKSDGLNDEKVPVERESLALVFADKNIYPDAPYYQAKKYADYLFTLLGIDVKYSANDDMSPDSIPFESKRSAIIRDVKNGKKIGIVGEFKSSVINNFKLSKFSSGFEIDLSVLFDLCQPLTSSYHSQSKYPASERDICFKVSDDIAFAQIIEAANNPAINKQLRVEISTVDIFKAEGTETKNITVRVKLTSLDHTLTGEEVADIIEQISSAVIAETNGVVV